MPTERGRGVLRCLTSVLAMGACRAVVAVLQSLRLLHEDVL